MSAGGDDSGTFDLFDVESDGNISSSRPKPPPKFQPKRKGVVPKPDTSSTTTTTTTTPIAMSPFLSVKKREDSTETKKEEGGTGLVVVEGSEGIVVGDSIVKVVDGGNVDVPMEVDEDDCVIREIDVFLNSSSVDVDEQLYVMQYPLRPFWRPYELEELCKDVRVESNQKKIELDLAVDEDSENYNRDAEEHLMPNLHTLCSSKVPSVTSYAVGVLKHNQLHLNPVHAVVQLRPSMKHLASSKAHKMNISSETEKSSSKIPPEREISRNSEISKNETWVSLEFIPGGSSFSRRYLQKTVEDEDFSIPFQMNPHDYLNNLCPVVSYDSNRRSGPLKGILLSMPLEERLRLLFKEGSQVHQLDAIMHFAPTYSVDYVLEMLPQYADLVQGFWVSKSSLLFEGREVLARDYCLLLFTKSKTIPFEKLKSMKLEVQVRILSPFARQRPSLKDWIFKVPTDMRFIKRYPHIVKQQKIIWASREKVIIDALHGISKSKPGKGRLNDPNERAGSLGAGTTTTEGLSSLKIR